MREQIIDLWKTSFGDTDDFIRLWFDRVYKDEQTIVIEENEKVISALQILPYEMTFCGTTIPVGYICGVCTLPSERGKGYMSRLMHQAMEKMQDRRYALAILIPATPGLFELYHRFDFVNAFDYSIEEIQSNDSISNPDSGIRIFSYKNQSSDAIYSYYHTKQCERDSSVIHSAYQFETICHDRILGGGKIWVALANEQPVGLAFTDPIDGKTLSIREMIFENTDTKYQLVQSMLTHHQLHDAKLRTPPTPFKSVPYGMARMINKELMLSLHHSFHHNNILPVLNNLDIPSLTQTLLNYEQRQTYMNLMLD